MNHTVHILHYFHLCGTMEIMSWWMFVLTSLFNALRRVDMRVLQVVVCWYHLMDSSNCPYILSLHSWDTYTPATKSIYTTTQSSSQKHPRWVNSLCFGQCRWQTGLYELTHTRTALRKEPSLYTVTAHHNTSLESPKLHTNTLSSTPQRIFSEFWHFLTCFSK